MLVDEGGIGVAGEAGVAGGGWRRVQGGGGLAGVVMQLAAGRQH